MHKDMNMKKVQLEVWTSFEKLCLMSAITKLKTSFADQNWVTISRYTKQIYESVSTCIDCEKRNDDWFTAKQCAAQYENLVKGCGTRRKKKIDRNTDYSDVHEALLLAYTQEFCEELQKSMGDIKDDYSKTKKFVAEIDSDKSDEEKFEDMILEMLEQEKATDVKSKLKSMLDEKNAEGESSSKSQMQQIMMSSAPSTSGEQRTSNTCSPLLTSLLQSPSRLLRQSPSTSSPTISSLLHSSPSVSITDSTLSKILDSPSELSKTATVTSVEASSVISQPSGPDSQQSSSDIKTKYSSPEGAKVIVERIVQETDEQEIFDDMSDIEQGVVENEIIIENESSPIKRFIPRRLDLEQVEDEEPEEEILETVEEIMERVEEAIIETVGESSINDIEPIETVSISDEEIENINIEDNTYEVIVVGSQEVSEQLTSSMSEDCMIIEESIADVDKTEDDNSHKLVQSSTIPSLNDEVENEDTIPKKSVLSQNSETFKGTSSIKIIMNDGISTKASGLEKSKTKIDSEKLSKVNSVEKLDEEGIGELVTKEEKTSSENTVDEKCSEKFLVEDNKSEADKGTLFSAKQKFPASSNSMVEGDKQDDSIKVSEDNGNLVFKRDSKICIGINKDDEINHYKQSSDDLPIHEIVSDNISTDESSISKQRIEINDHKRLKMARESQIEAQFGKNEVHADVTNKNSEYEFLSKQVESSTECLHNKENDVISKSNENVFQLDTEHPTTKQEKALIVETKKTESVIEIDNIIESEQKLIMKHGSEQLVENEKKISDKIILSTNDKSVNEFKKMHDVSRRDESEKSVVAAKVLEQPRTLDEAIEQVKNSENIMSREDKSKQVGVEEMESLGGKMCYSVKSTSAHSNEMTEVIVDNIAPELAAGSLATNDLTGTIISESVITKTPADSVFSEPLTESVTTKVLTGTVVAPLATESVATIAVMDSIFSEPLITRAVIEANVADTKDLTDTALPKQTVESNAIKPSMFPSIPAMKVHVDTVIPENTVESNATNNNMDSTATATRVVVDAVVEINETKIMVDSVSSEPAVEQIAARDQVDLIVSEQVLGSNKEINYAHTIIPEKAVESVMTEDQAVLVATTTKTVVDSIISEPTVKTTTTKDIVGLTVSGSRVVTDSVISELNTTKIVVDTIDPIPAFESVSTKAQMGSVITTVSDIVDSAISKPAAELNSTKALVTSVVPEAEIESNSIKALVSSVVPKPDAELNSTKALVGSIVPEPGIESNSIKAVMDSNVAGPKASEGSVSEPTAEVIETKDKVSSDETKNVDQRLVSKKISDGVQEVYHEHEETQESVEHYSDKLDETDEEDSDDKDKSESTEETEDNSVLTTEDSKDDLEDSLKFSSLETLSTHSVDSPPDPYYNDPKFASLRTKELELRSIMRKGFEEIKSKGAELVLTSNSNDEEKPRSKKNEKGISSKQSSKHEKPTKKRNKQKFPREKKVKTKSIPEKINREKLKEKTIKDKPSKAKLNKEKPIDGKFIKLGRKAKHLSSVDSKPDSPSLSNASSDEDRDYRSWKKSILLVYNRLASHKYASVFSKPITENEAPSYHQLILRPMDLSTIKRNIENGIIRTTVEFQRDMLLMVQNAIIYNKCDTPVYDMAKVMGEDMLAQMEVMVQALGDGVPLIGDTREEKQITRARTSKSSNDAPLSKKRKYQESSSDEIRPKRNKYLLSASS